MSAPTTPRAARPGTDTCVRARGVVALGALVLLYVGGAVARDDAPPAPVSPVSITSSVTAPALPGVR